MDTKSHQQAERVFDETIQRMEAAYIPTEDIDFAATATDANGKVIIIARYHVSAKTGKVTKYRPEAGSDDLV